MIHHAGNGKGTFFTWEGTVSFEVQGLSVEWYTKATAAVQNAIQCYDEKKKELLPGHHWIIFSRR